MERLMRRAVPLVVMVGALAASASASAFNAVTEFSGKSNPHGTWSYRVLEALLPVKAKNYCGVKGWEAWTNGGAEPTFVAIAGNKSENAVVCSTITAPPKTINLDPQGNQHIEVRWTAPLAGTYSVVGNFRGDDSGQVEHPVSVAVNGISAYANMISSFGQTDAFSLTVKANKGDIVDFRVETNPNNFRNLSTGLQATVTKVKGH